MGKENRFFFFPLPFAVTFHLIEACCSGSSQSPPGWMKTHPMLSHLPPQSEWGRQLSNPLCNSFSVCDGGDTEGVDKTRTGQMPSMLCTHRAQLRAVHMHQHWGAFFKPPKGLKLWFCKTALVLMSHWTKELLDLDSVTWPEPAADTNPGISSALTLNLLHHWASRKAWTETQTPILRGQVQRQVFASWSLLHPWTIFIWMVFLQPYLLLWPHRYSSWLVLASYSLACPSPIPVANTAALKQPGTVFPLWYWKINPFHPQRTRTAFNYFLIQHHSWS